MTRPKVLRFVKSLEDNSILSVNDELSKITLSDSELKLISSGARYLTFYEIGTYKLREDDKSSNSAYLDRNNPVISYVYDLI